MTHPIINRNYEIWSNLEFRYLFIIQCTIQTVSI